MRKLGWATFLALFAAGPAFAGHGHAGPAGGPCEACRPAVISGHSAGGAVISGGAGACAPATVTRTVQRPQYVTETRTIDVVQCVPEQRERTVTVYKQVPKTETKTRNFTVMVPQQKTRTETYTVQVPVQKQVEQSYNVTVPTYETRQGTRTVAKQVLERR